MKSQCQFHPTVTITTISIRSKTISTIKVRPRHQVARVWQSPRLSLIVIYLSNDSRWVKHRLLLVQEPSHEAAQARKSASFSQFFQVFGWWPFLRKPLSMEEGWQPQLLRVMAAHSSATNNASKDLTGGCQLDPPTWQHSETTILVQPILHLLLVLRPGSAQSESVCDQNILAERWVVISYKVELKNFRLSSFT